MISYLIGKVQKIKSDHIVVLSQNLGFRVYMPARSIATVRHGLDIELHTNLVVREESMTLFGFLSEDESETFEILQTVTGVGPRTAIAALDTFTPDELRSALADRDEKRLQKIPGIGKKSAQRMILDIGDKLGPASASFDAPAVNDDVADEVVKALVSLGWQKQQAEGAVAQFSGMGMNASDMLRAALVNLGGNRG
ncbi:MAG: Holliday junction branch migration protein RuvA [Actinomycetaceae bacterium]|nr:Holliday junction branch migration protein RuvA [Actinomycetaceae bacterium]